MSPAAVDLPGVGRAWRAALLLVLAALFLGGTVVGNDHWWPFSPWRMYATSTNPNASVASTLIEVRRADDPDTWAPAPLNPDSVGLNRAEIEGRLELIRRDPAVLGTLARSHAALRPQDSAWLAVRVVVRRFELRQGALTGTSRDEVVAQWAAS